MKRLIISMALLLAVTLTAKAQISQGVMLVGGSLGFQTVKEKYESGSVSVDAGSGTGFSLAPQFGYFFIDNLAGGVVLDFASSSFEPDGGEKQTSTDITFGPFARYYFGNIYAHAQIGFGSSKFDFGGGSESKYSLSQWGIGAGYAAFLNSSVAIEPMIMYQSHTETDKDSDPEIKDKFSGIGIRIAFQIYLGRE